MRALKITNTITRRDQKSVDKYLNEISRYDILTPEEELALFQQLRNGDERALSRIVNHNLRFVVSVAKQYQHLGFWLGDLINEGNIGLIKAARRFDETKGFKFISYAVWWIRQSILQAINEKSRKIKLPSNVSSNTTKVMNKGAEILQRKEREATMEELAEATGLSKREVKASLKGYQRCKSLDAPVQEDSLTSFVNFIEDQSIAKPDHKLAEEESQRIEVKNLLRLLPERQAIAIQMYFGINRKYPMTLSDIADYLGISRERVRQLKDRGLARLRIKAKRRQLNFAVS